MRIYGLGDLHLSFQGPADPPDFAQTEVAKPMKVFGPSWAGHYQRIYSRWRDTVSDDDLVLVPGDISWAISLEEARYDLGFLGLLPGTILLLRGNHDYWWKSISRVRAALPENVKALQNDAFITGGTAITGTRGWPCPDEGFLGEHDEKIYRREVERLFLSLKEGASRAERIITMLHYRPTNDTHEHNDFITLMQDFGVSDCIYGHLHAEDHEKRLPKEKWGIRFHLVSADFVDFTPVLIDEVE